MKICSVDGCEQKSHIAGYCRNHHRKWSLYGNPLEPPRGNGKKRQFCPVDACGKPVHGNGLCAMHYDRLRLHGDLHYREPEQRYHSFYTKGEPDSCWEWEKGRDKNGYGKFTIHHGVHIRAHRFGWILLHGPIPKGLLVCHTCDNPPCQNYNHWFLGTNKENTQDKMAKGRHKVNPYRDEKSNRFVRKPQPSDAL